jgi:hypothetical protein
MASHSMSNYQKMERMIQLPPLGDCKPSVMLAEMLEFCPAGESSTAVFAFLFLQRLPREIWVLLSQDDPANMRGIAAKADRLIAMHVPQSHESCVAVTAEPRQEEPCVVAAAQAARSRKGMRPKQKALGRRIDLSKRGQDQGAPCAPPCVTTTPNSANTQSSARRGAAGRKTRPQGRCFGDSPRSPFLCDGQLV